MWLVMWHENRNTNNKLTHKDQAMKNRPTKLTSYTPCTVHVCSIHVYMYVHVCMYNVHVHTYSIHVLYMYVVVVHVLIVE